MTHNLVYTATAAIVLGLLLLLKPAINYQPCGIALPIKSASTSTMSSNQIAILPPWHTGGEKLAWVNVEYHQDKASEIAAKAITAKASQLAQQQGANALQINVAGYSPPFQQGEPMAMYILRGVALNDV